MSNISTCSSCGSRVDLIQQDLGYGPGTGYNPPQRYANCKACGLLKAVDVDIENTGQNRLPTLLPAVPVVSTKKSKTGGMSAPRTPENPEDRVKRLKEAKSTKIKKNAYSKKIYADAVKESAEKRAATPTGKFEALKSAMQDKKLAEGTPENEKN